MQSPRMIMTAIALGLMGLARPVVGVEDVDIIACIFNYYRGDVGAPPLRISSELMDSAGIHADYMHARRNQTEFGRLGATIGQRLRKSGYDFSYAYGLTGDGYKTADQFAYAMIEKFEKGLMNPEIAHIGVGHSGRYWNIDMGDSFDDLETFEPDCS